MYVSSNNVDCQILYRYRLQVTTMPQKPQMIAYKKYAERLVQCLPMDDTIFVAKLSKHNLLPGNTNSTINALTTAADKASHFLDHVVKCALDVKDTSSFDVLVSVMEHCGYAHVEKLAHKIKSKINKASNIEQGTYDVLILI